MLKEKISIDPASECHKIQEFIKEKKLEMGSKGVVLGLSGGIDSAVVAALAARAVGPELVLGLFMPDKHSSSLSGKHAQMMASQLGTEYKVHDITPKLNKFGLYRYVPGKAPISFIRKVLRSFSKEGSGSASAFESGLGKSDSRFVAEANAFYRIKPRMRMMVLYELAERKNLLVAGATNRSEYAIGLYISQGCDDAADIMPLKHLWKTQVIQLAEYLDIPQEIIKKPPSPDFIPGMTDEGVIGLSYAVLDLILLGLDSAYSVETISTEIGCKSEDIDYVKRLKKKSQYRKDIPYTL